MGNAEMNPGIFAMHERVFNRRVGRPPLPHEHGAWMMLYTPLIVVLSAVQPVSPLPAALLFLTVTGAFLGQNALRLWRRRRGEKTGWWAGICLTAFAAGAVTLIWRYGTIDLLWIGLLAGGLLGRQALSAWFSGKRADRSLWGEILAVGGLTLTGPAAYVVSRGGIDASAAWVWAGFMLFFGSSVFYVKALISAAAVREAMTWRRRWRLGRGVLLYHIFLIVALAASLPAIGGWPAVLFAAGYLSVIVRAIAGWARLSCRIPSLKRIGMGEVCHTLWFAGFYTAGLLVAM